ncbi:50S ribosomal protein L29 [Brucepastera parasyntrophica]|uniref:50S ribosomal protein L29 n=1 Tax=Brucepastera parasyntrophica TaxID=2880008 RepID=UPI00210BF6A7|nr:50S ribosomal protein L29 [Brucepastera parasyntrophica]ULQ59320.1 50S ribosomal protein L29 [Brucepastera parasyntrophica]
MKKKELRNMSYAELVSKRAELTKKYMDVRFQLVIGHVENPLQKRTLRRQIAALNTYIRQHEIAGQANK